MIIFTGEALIDFIPVRDSSGKRAYVPAPGGSPYNTSIATARLEAPAAFLGGISRDFFGDRLVQNLTENGVGISLVSRNDNPSTLAFVDRSPGGEPRYAFFAREAADRQIRSRDIPTIPEETAAIAFGSISLLGEPMGTSVIQLVEREHGAGRRVLSFDPNIRESLITDAPRYRERVDRAVAASTIVKISDEDLAWILPGVELPVAAEELLSRGPSLVVVTAGGQGSHAFTSQTSVSSAAERTSVVDTIGAGDSFHAAVLAWLHHSRRLERNAIADLQTAHLSEMLRFASAVAAKTCSRAGADPPRLAEVQTRFHSWG